MEAQSLINAGIALAGFMGGWILNRIMKTLDKLDDDVKTVHKEYIRKDDYHRDIGEIKTMLKGIYDKLDSKADK